mmetsp:Transcript_45473/g.176837  ORF Transcript_45473/g.176837 Transcript_45473/m.176837 type:complete len:351 (-) Transcript_45473:1773-2825(-)
MVNDVPDSEDMSAAIIIPVRNGADYLPACLESVLKQDYELHRITVSIYDDGSTDPEVQNVIKDFKQLMEAAGIEYCTNGHPSTVAPRGVGGARNEAIQACQSAYLIFLDADDVMMTDRVSRQMKTLAEAGPNTIVGGNFDRIPADATPRYRDYHKRLGSSHLELFNHSFRDAPIAMPTIACSRDVWLNVNGFEEGVGVPEDLHFIYSHLRRGGELAKECGEPVIRYRYHPQMTSFGLDRRELLQVRARAFEDLVLDVQWKASTFMIWGAGRDGRAFFRCLSQEGKQRVRAFVDVDLKKIGTRCHGLEVLPVSGLLAPFVTCVALDRTNGAFEQNLERTGFLLGTDFYYIS